MASRIVLRSLPTVLSCAVLMGIMSWSPRVVAQNNTNTGTNANVGTNANLGGNNNLNNNGTTNNNLTINQGAGVIVDATGVVVMKSADDPTGNLFRERLANARAQLDPALAKVSKLRKVSLKRLERALQTALAAGQVVPDEIMFLAGLTRLEYVFLYPEQQEIVIAGPAEGYVLDPMGRAVGLQSGSAVLELQDLVVALRAYPPQGPQANVVGVSIDPTKEGLARHKEFMKFAERNAGPNDAERIAEGIRQAVGLQNVTVTGISPQTHFAQILVEADYRMKLIGIGLEPPPVRMQSYVDRASPRTSGNAMQRWFFVPQYDALRVSDDGLAMKLEGNGVKLVNADEVVQADGERVAAKGGDKASRAFVQEFTAKYDAIAAQAPVYGQLRNLIDLLVGAAFLQENGFYAKADWSMPLFGNEQAFSVEQFPTPKQVDTAVNVVWKKGRVMFPMGGGIHIEPRQALANENVVADESGEVVRVQQGSSLDGLESDRWWWD
jgi:Protein of unknown function (DUF1598)